jgi:hypothetical protein
MLRAVWKHPLAVPMNPIRVSRRYDHQQELFPLTDAPDGLLFEPEIMTETEEVGFLVVIKELPFGNFRMHGVDAKRHVVRFGAHYVAAIIFFLPTASTTRMTNLFQLSARGPAQLRGRATKVVRRDVRQAGPHDLRFQHLPHDLFAHPIPDDLITPVDRPEQMPFGDTRCVRPRIDRILHPRRHRDRPHPPVLPDEVYDAPTVVPLLNVLHRQIR